MWGKIWEWIVKNWVDFVLGIAFAGLSAGYARLTRKYRIEKVKNQAIENGLKGILRMEIIDTYEKCVNDGRKISLSRKDAICDVYRSYVALCSSQEDVDDTVKQLYEEIIKMPIT